MKTLEQAEGQVRVGVNTEMSHDDMLEMTWNADCEWGIVMERAKDVYDLTSHMLH